MYVYLQVLQERGKRRGEKRRGKASRSHARGEENPSERRRVVRERDRVGARRLAVAVRAAGRALVDGPEHDAADPSVDVGDGAAKCAASDAGGIRDAKQSSRAMTRILSAACCSV